MYDFEMKNIIRNIHNIRIPNTDEHLLHYCSWDSYFSIIESQNIRFCALPYMNDPLELDYGIHFIRNKIEEYKECFPEEIHSPTFEKLIFFAEKELPLRYSRVYIFCMSGFQDRLAMWRAYGDDGEGCAIGFSKEKLLELSPKSDDMSFFLTPLIYKKNHLEKITEYIFHILQKFSNINMQSKNEDEVNQFVHNFFDEVTMVPLLIKNSEYVEEVEWRLILHIGQRLWHSSESPEILVNGRPTVEVPLQMLLGEKREIPRLVVGPSNKYDNAQRDRIIRRSDQNRFRITDLKKSNIRYRNRNHEF